MKKYISLLALVLVCATLFVGCGTTEKKPASSKPTSSKAEVTVDYSKYPFAGVKWTRDAENDIEYIRFGADGTFSYYCACGNSVNDSDLCEGYTYDDATKTITLDCLETTDEMVTVIKIVKCEENELQLDFDGDIRIFTKE